MTCWLQDLGASVSSSVDLRIITLPSSYTRTSHNSAGNIVRATEASVIFSIISYNVVSRLLLSPLPPKVISYNTLNHLSFPGERQPPLRETWI